ncbi:hypothetical protein V6N13_132974 [Hibiscus sabdariffa]
MGKILTEYMFPANIPTLKVTCLYFLNHNVASHLAQQGEYKLSKPIAYNYDILVSGTTSFICGLLGLSNLNEVLQSSMYTKSLAFLKRQKIRKQMLKSAQDSMFQQGLKDTLIKGYHKQDAKNFLFPTKHIDVHLLVRVGEQRISYLLQSFFVGLSWCAVPLKKTVSTSVLWGYFAHMTANRLLKNQFWEQTFLLFITPSRHYRVLEAVHALIVEYMHFLAILMSTFFPFVHLHICFGVTWICPQKNLNLSFHILAPRKDMVDDKLASKTLVQMEELGEEVATRIPRKEF